MDCFRLLRRKKLSSPLTSFFAYEVSLYPCLLCEALLKAEASLSLARVLLAPPSLSFVVKIWRWLLRRKNSRAYRIYTDFAKPIRAELFFWCQKFGKFLLHGSLNFLKTVRCMPGTLLRRSGSLFVSMPGRIRVFSPKTREVRIVVIRVLRETMPQATQKGGIALLFKPIHS